MLRVFHLGKHYNWHLRCGLSPKAQVIHWHINLMVSCQHIQEPVPGIYATHPAVRCTVVAALPHERAYLIVHIKLPRLLLDLKQVPHLGLQQYHNSCFNCCKTVLVSACSSDGEARKHSGEKVFGKQPLVDWDRRITFKCILVGRICASEDH